MTRYRAPFAAGAEKAIDEATANKLLSAALANGGDYADLFFEYRAAGSLSYDEGILKSAGRGVDQGLGVRVTKGDATGYAYVEDLTEDAMLNAARTAGAIATGGGAAAAHGLSMPPLNRRYELDSISLDTDGLTKRAFLERADKAARAYDSRISKVQVGFTEEIREILIATSDGTIVRDRQPLLRFNVSAVAEDKGKRQAGRSGGGGRVGLDFFTLAGQKPEDHAKEAARIAIAMLNAEDAPAGELPVVLAPGDSGILLHEAVGHGLEADFNRKGTSNYSGKIGEMVASDLVTVVDDPSYAHGRGSINVDDEGTPAVASTLIENGKLRGYMHDRLSAKHYETSSANGRRQSFRSAPMPRMTNTMLLGGPHAPEEIIESTKRGIYAKRFSGGQVNITNGDFVFSLTEAYLIEDGKLTAPLKGVNLIGNGPDVLGKVDMLGADVELSNGIWTCGKEGQSVPVGVGCPTVRVGAITVGGTKVG